MSKILKYYFSLANWLMEDALTKGKYLAWQGHSQLVIVLSTGLLMWSYAFLAYFTVSDPTPGYVGFVASAIHLLSPLVLRYGKNINLATHLLIGAGLIHQGCFAYYSGGFNSNILIWYGILPMLGGIILGRVGVIIWMSLTTSVAALALYKMVYLSPFPMLITDQGWLIAQGLMVFGWIFLSSSIIYAFTELMEKHNEEVAMNASKIRTLVRVLCHDISNPLTTVRNRIKLIDSINSDTIVAQKLEKLESPLNSIQGIIDQIKNWEAIESGKLEVNLERICVGDVITETLELFEERIIEKKLRLDIQIPEQEIYVFAEKACLQSQILSNIISNAIKFSHQGDIISIYLADVAGHAKVTISDQGIGIPQDILTHIFDPSIKTSRPGTLGERGTGFGMPIVKAYIEKFGGKIDIRSQTKAPTSFLSQGGEEEKPQQCSGTIFELSFPLHACGESDISTKNF